MPARQIRLRVVRARGGRERREKEEGGDPHVSFGHSRGGEGKREQVNSPRIRMGHSADDEVRRRRRRGSIIFSDAGKLQEHSRRAAKGGGRTFSLS